MRGCRRASSACTKCMRTLRGPDLALATTDYLSVVEGANELRVHRRRARGPLHRHPARRSTRLLHRPQWVSPQIVEASSMRRRYATHTTQVRPGVPEIRHWDDFALVTHECREHGRRVQHTSVLLQLGTGVSRDLVSRNRSENGDPVRHPMLRGGSAPQASRWSICPAATLLMTCSSHPGMRMDSRLMTSASPRPRWIRGSSLESQLLPTTALRSKTRPLANSARTRIPGTGVPASTSSQLPPSRRLDSSTSG